jgi:hypothetical protein
MNRALLGTQSPFSQLYSQKSSKDRFLDELDIHASYASYDEFVLMISPCSYSKEMYEAV